MDIHPRWAIDEYAIILRNWVWLSPPHPPTIMDAMDRMVIVFWSIVGVIIYKTDKGAIFCHVSRISPDSSEMPCVTSGTQKWNGAMPNFMVSAMVIIVHAVGFMILEIVHWPEFMRLMMTANMSSIEAVDCTRKYLVVASVDRGLWVFIRIGRTANMFISNPIQIINQ